MSSHIKNFPSGPFSTNAIVLAEGSEAVIVDPAPGSLGRIDRYVVDNGLVIRKILITHSHWDHIADCAAAKEKYQVPVVVHREDVANLEQPGSDGIPYFLPVPIHGVHADGYLAEGEKIGVGALQLEVWHTPGHSPGLVSFYCAAHKFLICGDLFFHGAIGTLALPTAQPEQMWASLARVAALPAETVVYPGHGRRTTIGEESWLPKAKELFG